MQYTVDVPGIAIDRMDRPNERPHLGPLAVLLLPRKLGGFGGDRKRQPLAWMSPRGAQLDSIAARIAEQYPVDAAGWGALVVPLREETVGKVRQPPAPG
jgi:hypothetical protein